MTIEGRITLLSSSEKSTRVIFSGGVNFAVGQTSGVVFDATPRIVGSGENGCRNNSEAKDLLYYMLLFLHIYDIAPIKYQRYLFSPL